MKPRLTFLVPFVSNPVIGPVTEIARMLEGTASVEIVGPDMGDGVCAMYRDYYPYISVPTPRIYRFPDYLWERERLARACTGEVIVAVKAWMQTVPVAMAVKKRRGARVYVYLDEWDGALWERLTPKEKLLRWIKHAHHPIGEHYVPYVERMIRSTDGVICTTSYLAKKFNGVVVPVGVDTSVFDPAVISEEDRRQLREKLGISGAWVVGFGGVVRPHKGIETILEALCRLGRADAKLLIIGPNNEHVRELQDNPRYAGFLRVTGSIPKKEMPRYLALADAIVLPLENNSLAQSQMPCKIFEAMAMGKPVIASDVSDMRHVLDGCGMVVPAGDAGAVATAIGQLMGDDDLRMRLGRMTRERCIRLYDIQVVQGQYAKALRL